MLLILFIIYYMIILDFFIALLKVNFCILLNILDKQLLL